MKQRRWLCHTCSREWVAPFDGCDPDSAPFLFIPAGSIVGVEWHEDIGCPMPGCGSLEIELVEYAPPFPGGDISREPHLASPPPPPVVTPPLLQRFLGLFR